MSRYVVGIDLGGTNIRSAGVDLYGNILSRDKRPSDVKMGKEAVLKNILRSIESVCNSTLLPDAIGIGIPGVIHRKEGIVSQSPNFPDWIDYNIKKRLERDINIPFFIENDANAASYGEGWLGAAKETDSYCMFTLGTGVGGGLVLKRQIWHGVDGMGGELGHIIVEPDGKPCGCGGHGCVEQYASATAIKNMIKEAFNEREAANIRSACNGNPDIMTAEILYRLAKEGDPKSVEIFKRVGRYLGMAIVSIIHIFNLGLIIIGGGTANAWDVFIEPLKKEIQERAYAVPGRSAKVKKAVCGDDAGILGAAKIAIDFIDKL